MIIGFVVFIPLSDKYGKFNFIMASVLISQSAPLIIQLSKSVVVTQVLCIAYGATFSVKNTLAPMMIGEMNGSTHSSKYRSYVLQSTGYLSSIIAIMILFNPKMVYLIYFEAVYGIILITLFYIYMTESPVYLINMGKYAEVKNMIRH